jgi:hypothetical protein
MQRYENTIPWYLVYFSDIFCHIVVENKETICSRKQKDEYITLTSECIFGQKKNFRVYTGPHLFADGRHPGRHSDPHIRAQHDRAGHSPDIVINDNKKVKTSHGMVYNLFSFLQV